MPGPTHNRYIPDVPPMPDRLLSRSTIRSGHWPEAPPVAPQQRGPKPSACPSAGGYAGILRRVANNVVPDGDHGDPGRQ